MKNLEEKHKKLVKQFFIRNLIDRKFAKEFRELCKGSDLETLEVQLHETTFKDDKPRVSFVFHWKPVMRGELRESSGTVLDIDPTFNYIKK